MMRLLFVNGADVIKVKKGAAVNADVDKYIFFGRRVTKAQINAIKKVLRAAARK